MPWPWSPRSASRRSSRGGLPPVPIVGAEDSRWSAVASAVDLYSRPNQDLVDVLLDAGNRARSMELGALLARCTEVDARWVRQWPGEHYRLLAALTAVLEPAVVVEIGTFRGHGALALASGSPACRIITYDLVPWRDIDGTALRVEDVESGRVEQRIGDLGDAGYLADQTETLRSADLIFVDGPKDGSWEQHALEPILRVLADRRRLVVLDDIRLLEMVQLWRDLPYPKLDATSLGHWSGTGLLHTA